jgi:hypothetical protein
MRKYIYLSILVASTFYKTNAQIPLTKTLPPVGAKLTIYQAASNALARPSGGENQVWDYSSLTFSPQFNLETKALSSVAQKYQDSCPTAKYVEIMNVPGAPTPDYLPMEFFEDKGEYMVRVGQKGTNLNLEKKNDTLFVFNQAFGSGQVYSGSFREYAGYGTLKIGTEVYDSVIMIRNKSVVNTTSDTGYNFFKVTPYWTRLAAVMFSNGQSVGMSYWKPSMGSTTGLVIQNRLPSLTIYPNPANQRITINGDFEHLLIMDIQGRVIYETEEEQHTNVVNIADLKEGIYVVKAIKNGEVFTQKFIKQ